jgi:topoisomerase IA-like protein
MYFCKAKANQRHIKSIDKVSEMQRLCIYPKDIQIVTGKSERYGRYLIKKIKEHLNKEPHQAVSVKEFADYLGLCPNAVHQQIR